MLAALLAEATTDINPVEYLPSLGFSAVFLWQWLRSDKERQASAREQLALNERTIPVLVEAVMTMKELHAAMEKSAERAAANLSPQTPPEVQQTIRRLEGVAQELSQRLRDSERQVRDGNQRDERRGYK